jgi:hypothetical protein
MANVPNTSTNPDSAQNFFNGYFSQTLQVSSAVYGQVNGFFLARTSNPAVADSLSQALLTLTYNNNLDPLVMIAEFDKTASESDLKKLLISFFNASKGSTSKLGYFNNRQNNNLIKRSILT